MREEKTWETIGEGKLCPKCGKVKPFTGYYKYDTGGNKITYWCRDYIEYYIKNTSVGAN